MKYTIFLILMFTSTQFFSQSNQSFKLGSLVSEFNKTGKIVGFVYDGENQNKPLIFAEVVVKDTNSTVITNVEGMFILNLKPGKYSLVFNFTGYKPIEVLNLEVSSNNTLTLNQTLNALKMETYIFEANTVFTLK